MMLNSPLLQRICNNVMIIEVWNRIGPHDHADQVKCLLNLVILLMCSVCYHFQPVQFSTGYQQIVANLNGTTCCDLMF